MRNLFWHMYTWMSPLLSRILNFWDRKRCHCHGTLRNKSFLVSDPRKFDSEHPLPHVGTKYLTATVGKVVKSKERYIEETPNYPLNLDQLLANNILYLQKKYSISNSHYHACDRDVRVQACVHDVHDGHDVHGVHGVHARSHHHNRSHRHNDFLWRWSRV